MVRMDLGWRLTLGCYKVRKQSGASSGWGQAELPTNRKNMCMMCDRDKVEDVLHFLVLCEEFEWERQQKCGRRRKRACLNELQLQILCSVPPTTTTTIWKGWGKKAKVTQTEYTLAIALSVASPSTLLQSGFHISCASTVMVENCTLFTLHFGCG